MPRAFLITTHRRYNLEQQDGSAAGDETKAAAALSPEHVVSLADCSSQASDNSSECPDELYNLTKLAEVAVATGQIRTANGEDHHHHHHQHTPQSYHTYTHKLFDKSSRIPRPHLTKTDQLKSYNHHQPSSTTISIVPHVSLINNNNNNNNHNNNHQEEPSSSSSSTSSIGGGNGDGNDHECGDCGKRYSTSSNLARHRQTHRSPGDKKARRCPHCDKIYVSMPAFSMHVRTHNQGCKCQYCGKCFSRPWLLQGHIRTHTGEKPFKCTICNKAFADKSNLRAHIQTHSNTKPHICGRCGKAFALKSYLYKHEESSCMRLNTTTTTGSSTTSTGRHSSREATPDKILTSSSSSSPTPVIVTRLMPADSVIKSPDNKSPMLYRSTVISPNPERLLYSTVKHPSVILNATRFGINHHHHMLNHHQDQPMDFSTQGRNFQNGRSYGLAIAV